MDLQRGKHRPALHIESPHMTKHLQAVLIVKNLMTNLITVKNEYLQYKSKKVVTFQIMPRRQKY